MNILVACEYSGTVTSAFRKAGHYAMSCDLLPTEGNPDWHLQMDCLYLIEQFDWDMLIAFPPCTYLCSSGLHWNKSKPGRLAKSIASLDFVRKLMSAPIEKIAIENPVGIISSRIRRPDQIIQPWQYGHPEQKATCLWLKNLPLLQPTNILPPRPRWDNQTASGQNKIGSSKKDRWKLRSKTYEGIAAAMAEQWS